MSVALAEDRLAIGGNMPPPDVDPLLDRLRDNHADLIKRRDELLGGIERAPAVIEDEDTAGRMADFVRLQIDKFIKHAKVVHQDEKKYFLDSGRTVDGFKDFLIDDILAGKKMLNAARIAFADKKAAAEKRRRDEEAYKARKAQKALDRAAEEAAAKLRNETDLNAAIVAEEAAEAARLTAEKAAKEAAAKPAELGRTRGEYGSLTTLKQFWDFSDLDRATLDLEALRDHIPGDALEKAVRSWIKANKDYLEGGRRIDGVRIYENTRL